LVKNCRLRKVKKVNKADFVTKCGELLAIAKPNLVRCDYRMGKDIDPTATDKFVSQNFLDEDEYVIVTCENGYKYYLLVTGNSLNAIASTIFDSMASK